VNRVLIAYSQPMNKLVVILLIALSAFAPVCAQKPLAITHVAIVDTTNGRIHRDMTVISAGERITVVGKSSAVTIPQNAQLIDGSGKFLIPGLWDMHVHIGDSDFDKLSNLRLFIANGVTGIRIMDGAPAHRLWRREIHNRNLLGPRMVIASSIIDGPSSYVTDVKVNDADEARAAVRNAQREGADFIKVHDTLPRAAYFAIIDEAKKSGLPVAGHVPASITAKEASEAGQKSIEHFTGLAEAEADVDKADELIRLFRKNHTWVCPTMIMRSSYAVLDNPILATDYRLRYAKPAWRSSWLKMTKAASSVPASEWESRRETIRREKALVGRFQHGGVGLLAGSDDANPYVLPGFSLHDELALLVQSGLTPLQALQTATLNPAKFFNQVAAAGSIANGKNGDMVLLDGNPLENIRNIRKVSGVIIHGRFLNRTELNRILAEIEKNAS
jgi:imidazolonepropionase-like amidohydrolase